MPRVRTPSRDFSAFRDAHSARRRFRSRFTAALSPAPAACSGAGAVRSERTHKPTVRTSRQSGIDVKLRHTTISSRGQRVARRRVAQAPDERACGTAALGSGARADSPGGAAVAESCSKPERHPRIKLRPPRGDPARMRASTCRKWRTGCSATAGWIDNSRRSPGIARDSSRANRERRSDPPRALKTPDISPRSSGGAGPDLAGATPQQQLGDAGLASSSAPPNRTRRC